MQRMQSASLMVSRRCATVTTVLPSMRVLRPSLTRDWDSLSKADVASSRIRMGLSFSIARAMATRCSSPPLRVSLETRVCTPRGKRTGFWKMSSCSRAALHASSTSSSLGSSSQP
mmetsp:Transcript_105706/g.309178  ORF Transcript_105706/g.309178 Transcript_105706/m.309178 type:complete len:115 (-) Transcript_105706:2131-2475(-)